MTNPIIETDLGKLLNKLNSRFDNLDGKIDKYQDENRREFKSIDNRLKNIEVSQARLEEKYDAQEKIT
jgi:predicted nuclease with TOPRIM domain